MTQQIINLGTGPDSYTGDTVRDAFLKVNENFTELYGGNITSNVTANTITATGNVTASYFLGNGALLTGLDIASGNYGNANVAAYLPIYSGNIAAGNITVNGNITGNIIRSVVSVRVGDLTDPVVALASSGGTAFLTSNPTIRASGGNVNMVLTSTPDNFILLNATSGRMGFKTTALTNDFTFNGIVKANSYVSDTSSQLGFMFNTNTGLSGLSHTIEGNATVIKISHDDKPVARFYDTNNTILLGHLEIRNEEADATTFPDPFLLGSTNVNSYSQLVLQNFSNGNQASSDVVVTADNGNDSAFFGDFGIASSDYLYPGYTIIKPNDIYLLAVSDDITGPGSSDSGNLILGTTNGNIKLFVGPPEDESTVATFSTTSANIVSTLGNWEFKSDGNLALPASGLLEVSGGIVAGPIISSPAPYISGFSSISAQTLTASIVVKTGVYTTSTLPNAATSGMGARAFVTDATSSTFGASYTGDGSSKVPVYSDGTSWFIG